MKKFLLITFSIIGVVIVLALCALLLYTYRTSDGYAQKITTKAVSQNNSLLCDHIYGDITNSDRPDGCYSSVAIQNRNVQACEDKGWNCYRKYFDYYLGLNQESDPKVCDVIVGAHEKDVCRGQQASTYSNVGLCQFITEAGGRYSCYTNYASKTKDIGICNTYLPEGKRDICYSQTAQSADNEIFCTDIQNSQLKSNCISLIRQ